MGMPTTDFEFVVKEAFPITGRGVGVLGDLIAGNLASGDSVVLHLGSVVVGVATVTVESILRDGTDQGALLLHNMSLTDVRPGCVLRAM